MPLTEAIKRRLRKIVGSAGYVDSSAGLRVYECDGYTLEKARPELVLLPASTEQVQEVVHASQTWGALVRFGRGLLGCLRGFLLGPVLGLGVRRVAEDVVVAELGPEADLEIRHRAEVHEIRVEVVGRLHLGELRRRIFPLPTP